MGLAPYGQPTYADLIREKLIDIKDDGSFWMDMTYFNYCEGLTMTSSKFERLFGGPPRKPESPLTEREMDLAASVQVVTEEIVLREGRHVRAATGQRRLCLAGGVALNCVANGRLMREGVFDDLWVQPAAGDAGGALGVALYIWHQLLEQPRPARPVDAMQGAWLGPRFQESTIRELLDQKGLPYRYFESDDELCRYVVRLLVDEQVIGWFQGRMEFGPRALGARSIIGDARSPRLQSVMNLKIKFRESFRPFAPAVLQDRAPEYFELTPGTASPYMMLVADVTRGKRLPSNGVPAKGIDKLKQLRSLIPAVTHVDNSARIQTVDARHGRFDRLIRAFERETGCPVLINTSFNVRGEPIVCTPEQAWRCFVSTDIDALVLERFVIEKRAVPEGTRQDAHAYAAEFELD